MTERHACGFVSLVGVPNVGKTTLLNFLVGRKVGIVSNKPQTTRNRITGIRTLPGSQVIFIDHPGFHAPKYRLNREMVRLTMAGLKGVDLILLVLDARNPPGPLDRELMHHLAGSTLPVLVLMNKIDLVPQKPDLLPRMAAAHAALPKAEIFPVCAATGQGLAEVEAAMAALLPEGPALFPEEQWTTQSETFFIAELVREKVLATCRDEIPYAVAVEIVLTEEDEEKNLLKVHARVICEKEGQKAILIGKGGEKIKQIGTLARTEIESLLAVHLFLDLQVKVVPGWRDDASFLRRILPPETEEE
jgi:GTP-binding protein Era